MMWNRGRPPGGTVARRAATLAAALLALGAATAWAQESPRPSLGGHTFLSTDLLPEVFVHTYVRASLGYAMEAEIDYPPPVVLGDTLQGLNGSLAYVLVNIEYQRLLRDWMAVRIGANLQSRIGTQTTSLVYEGVTVTQGYGFDWLARVRQTPKTMLTGSLGVVKQTVTIVDLQQFVEDVAQGVPNARVLDNVPTVRSRASLRYAWAVNSKFGVTALGQASYGESPRRRYTTDWGYDVGASVDFDAKAAYGVPVGAALAYRLSSLPALTTTDQGNSSQTVLRIAYSADRELVALDVLGLFNRENSRASAVWAGGVSFSIRIYY
jgi:hypothetical protein